MRLLTCQYGIMLYLVSITLVSLGNASFSAAILPFFTDQVIGATADELSTLIYWYDNFGFVPLLICLSFATGIANMSPTSLLIDLEYKDILLNIGMMKSWLFPLVLIPIHQFLLNPCFHKYFPTILNCISAGSSWIHNACCSEHMGIHYL